MTLNKILENFVWDIVCDTIVSVLTVLLAEVSLQMFSKFFKIKCPLDGFLCSRMIWAWSYSFRHTSLYDMWTSYYLHPSY